MLLLPNLTCLLSAAYENPIKPLNTHPTSSTKFYQISPFYVFLSWITKSPVVSGCSYYNVSWHFTKNSDGVRNWEVHGEKVPGKDNGERAQDVAGKCFQLWCRPDICERKEGRKLKQTRKLSALMAGLTVSVSRKGGWEQRLPIRRVLCWAEMALEALAGFQCSAVGWRLSRKSLTFAPKLWCLQKVLT